MQTSFVKFSLVLCASFASTTSVVAESLSETFHSLVLAGRQHEIVAADAGECVDFYNSAVTNNLENSWRELDLIGLTISHNFSDQKYDIFFNSPFLEAQTSCTNGYAVFDISYYDFSDILADPVRSLKMCTELPQIRRRDIPPLYEIFVDETCTQLYESCLEISKRSVSIAPSTEAVGPIESQCGALLSLDNYYAVVSDVDNNAEQVLLRVSLEFIESRSRFLSFFQSRSQIGLNALLVLMTYENLSEAEISSLVDKILVSGMRSMHVDDFTLALALRSESSDWTSLIEGYSIEQMLGSISVTSQIIAKDVGDTFLDMFQQAQGLNLPEFEEVLYTNANARYIFFSLSDSEKMEFAVKAFNRGLRYMAGYALAMTADVRDYTIYYLLFDDDATIGPILDPFFLMTNDEVLPSVRDIDDLHRITQNYSATRKKNFEVRVVFRDLSHVFSILYNRLGNDELMHAAVQNYKVNVSPSMSHSEKVILMYNEIISMYGYPSVSEGMRQFDVTRNELSVLGGDALKSMDTLIALEAIRPLLLGLSSNVRRPNFLSGNFDWESWKLVAETVKNNDASSLLSLPAPLKEYAIEQLFFLQEYERVLDIAEEQQKGALYPIIISELDEGLKNVISSDEFVFGPKFLLLR